MYKYEQATGRFLFVCGRVVRLVHVGYAGAPGCVNDPHSDHLRSRGPLPKGLYRIQLREHPRFAPPAFFLAPEPGNRMHGRGGFFIHGDNASGDQSASTGCIVLPRGVRERIRDLIDFVDTLEVVSGLAPEFVGAGGLGITQDN